MKFIYGICKWIIRNNNLHIWYSWFNALVGHNPSLTALAITLVGFKKIPNGCHNGNRFWL